MKSGRKEGREGEGGEKGGGAGGGGERWRGREGGNTSLLKEFELIYY